MVKFRDFLQEDENHFIDMCTEFYSSDAVLYPLKKEDMQETFRQTVGGSPYMRGITFVADHVVVGYAHLSLTYSNEAAGMVIYVEEVFVKNGYRGQGIGKAFFEWMFDEYKGKVNRYRLEVARDNEAVVKLYERMGFDRLEYIQMILDC